LSSWWAAVGGAIVLVGVCIGFFPRAWRIRNDYALACAIAAAERTNGGLPVRIVVAPHGSALSILGAPSTETIGRALVAALDRARRDHSAEAQHAAGISSLLTNAPGDAVRYLQAAADAANNAAYWSDLGAAEYMLAQTDRNDEHLLASLGASEHAIVLDPGRPEPAYNFALTVEGLGLTPAAAELWTRFRKRPAVDVFSDDACGRLLDLQQRRSDNATWLDAVTREITNTTLAELARAYPQQARLWTEGECLSRWARAASASDRAGADHFLQQARIIGGALQRQHHESLLAETVAAIDSAAAHDPTRLRSLIEAHIHYARARLLYRSSDVAAARSEFQAAEQLFETAHSPFAGIAGAFVASTFHDADDLQGARQHLVSLLAKEDEHPGHVALRAQLRYEIARTDAVRGYWGDAVTEASEAAALYHAIGEIGNEGMTASLIAEAYDFIGQPAVSMRYGVAAVRLLAKTGDLYKLRVTTANLCRAAMRRDQWYASQALLRVERALEPLSPDDVLSSDTSLRAAVIAQQLGHPIAAQREMDNAKARASQLRDATLRTSRLAEILAASAVLTRKRKPADAIAQLNNAIAYQQQTNREAFLPHLHLERGLAELALHDEQRALADFEQGISLLERQRSHINEASLRYGIFDDSHELFANAIALHVKRNTSADLAAAFAIVERGRARAVVEQIAGTPHPPETGTDIRSLQHALPPRTLLLEYQVLPDRILIFLIDGLRFDLRQVHVDSTTLSVRCGAFMTALTSRATKADLESAAAGVHDLLLKAVPEYRRYERLLFVPDPKFQQVPFAALRDSQNGNYVIEDHIVIMSPSAGVFQEGREQVASNRMDHTAIFLGATGDAALSLRPLPDAQREAARIAACYPRSSQHNADTSSVATFMQEAPQSDVVHFTGHALIDAVDPAQSALVMARENGRPSLLHCIQIGTVNLRRTRIVVLAACSTMRGRAGMADGTPSIARSFLAAGAASVIGTLWDIDDAETSALITDVHHNIAAGFPAAIALRNAQIKAIRSSYPPAQHAGSWAAFEVMGAGGM